MADHDRPADAAETEADVARAAEALGERIRHRFGGASPSAGVTMGSGLGGLADAFTDPLVVEYADLPGWPAPTVEGHTGRAVLGTLDGTPAIGLSGRVHLYEGGDPRRTAFYVRVLAAAGVPILFLSNAAGAIRDGFAPGELMLISDHINLTGRSPLTGPVFGAEPRFPDMSEAYDAELRGTVSRIASGLGVRLHEGVYVAVHGPSYETPAEIRMLRTIGADAVGMSTVPEVIVARAAGLRCVAVSCLTNYAAGVSDTPLDHAEVIATTRVVQTDFQRLVAASIAAFGASGDIRG
ncbi:MAG: purine-nucleoside phosphorylase [Gemmatimonadota bacterium]|nr:purine-nucleoside phosphorylase [Gemmatimonadota bacterium]